MFFGTQNFSLAKALSRKDFKKNWRNFVSNLVLQTQNPIPKSYRQQRQRNSNTNHHTTQFGF